MQKTLSSMLLPTCMGSLASPEIKKGLAEAQAQPEKWIVALIPCSGKRRTDAQNRLYHAFLGQLAQTQGRSVMSWHEFLVEKFLGYHDVVGEDGYTRKALRSTSGLTVAEFTGFLSACFAWADEHGMRT